MNTRRRSLLASLVLLSNTLVVTLPADACGGGTPCPPKRFCILGPCSEYTLEQFNNLCESPPDGTPGCCTQSIICADDPAPVYDCIAIESLLSCRYFQMCP